MNMAKKNTGALIAIQQNIDLIPYIHTGEMFRADVNARLIENVFFKNSPLHDGAMIIVDNEIIAAACILPIAHNAVIPQEMGLRHHSGLGMASVTDAIVIIVSEERGTITVAHNGKLSIDITAEELQRILTENK
jgi:DNA integrity scanning protein DisA with diadenylate cyclase activity